MYAWTANDTHIIWVLEMIIITIMQINFQYLVFLTFGKHPCKYRRVTQIYDPPVRYMLKGFCGFDTGFIKQQEFCNNRIIVKFFPQITQLQE